MQTEEQRTTGEFPASGSEGIIESDAASQVRRCVLAKTFSTVSALSEGSRGAAMLPSWSSPFDEAMERPHGFVEGGLLSAPEPPRPTVLRESRDGEMESRAGGMKSCTASQTGAR